MGLEGEHLEGAGDGLNVDDVVAFLIDEEWTFVRSSSAGWKGTVVQFAKMAVYL